MHLGMDPTGLSHYDNSLYGIGLQDCMIPMRAGLSLCRVSIKRIALMIRYLGSSVQSF